MSESEKMDGDQPARLFISYSHKDEGMAKELLTHLRTLADSGTICVWYDRMIEPGHPWNKEIEEHLKNVSSAAPLLRFGMELAMPSRFDRIDFYGKGDDFVTGRVYGVYIEQAAGTKIENLTVNNYLANYEGKVKYPAATLNPIHRFKNFVNRTAGELNQ